MRIMIMTLLCCCVCAVLNGSENIWLEGESPRSWPEQEGLSRDWSQEQPELCSGGNLLHLAGKEMAEPLRLRYDFRSDAGSYELWLRLGYEYHRAPFSWRIDDGPWQTVDPLQLTTNVQCVAASQGSSTKVLGWLPLGEVAPAPGDHVLELRIEQGADPLGTRFMLDAICLSPEPFVPNYRHRPGADYRDDRAEAAAQRLVQVADAAPLERQRTSLDGLWQIAAWDPFDSPANERLQGDTQLPDLARLPWYGIEQPGDRDAQMVWMDRAHRYILRTRFELSPAMAERGLLLDIQRFSTIASVFVNGQHCGWSKNAWTVWQCDLSPALQPGVNELCIVIRDSNYSNAAPRVGGRDEAECQRTWELFDAIGHRLWWASPRCFGRNRVRDLTTDRDKRSGLLSKTSLISMGRANVADVFTRADVDARQLAVDLELRNHTGADARITVRNEVRTVDAGPDAEPLLRLPEQQLRLADGARDQLTVSTVWPEHAALWWPDDPVLHRLDTTLLIDGEPVDRQQTRFGFREIGWDSHLFSINGVPWQLWSDLDYGPNVHDLIERAKTSGRNHWRMWLDGPWGGMTRTEILAACDEAGMLVRSSGIFDGQMMNYAGEFRRQVRTIAEDGSWHFDWQPNEPLFDNWREQVLAWIRAERQHPSVYIWTLENEITYIAAHNSRQHAIVEPRISAVSDAVMRLDPTRPTMVDGGNALRDHSMPVNGAHYTERMGLQLGDFPDGAYSRENFYTTKQRDAWDMARGKPIMKGEVFYASGYGTDGMAWVGGPQCFQGPVQCREARDRFARMLSEGWRWAEVSAWHFWMGGDATTSYYSAWQPIALLCRQWNWTFGAGEQVQRDLLLHNNSSYAGPLTARWQWLQAGEVLAEDEQRYELEAGGRQTLAITFQAPMVRARSEALLRLQLLRDGEVVFQDDKQAAIVAPQSAQRPAITGDELVICDPQGALSAYLDVHGIEHRRMAPADPIPEGARMLVIGSDAIAADATTDMRWLRFAAAGGRVLVLDQAHPLRHQAIPAEARVSDRSGRIGFIENPTHPVFTEMRQEDFFCFGPDHLLYRQAYTKPGSGGRSLIQCDDRLRFSPMIECAVGDGLMLLSQVAVDEKLASSGVAQLLVANLLEHVAGYQRSERELVLSLPSEDRRSALIRDLGMGFEQASDPLQALQPGMRVAVLDASPETLQRLAAHPERIDAFTEAGGWLMLWGLDAQGLDAFNRIVGHEHLLRPFRTERLDFQEPRDPLLAGLTPSDITFNTGRKMMRFAPMYRPVDDVFSSIVSHDDIAPFCRLPDGLVLGKGQPDPGKDHDAYNLVNNFTDADHWQFGYTSILSSGHAARIDFELPRPEPLLSLRLNPGGSYEPLTRIRVHFSQGEPLEFDVAARNETQEFDLGGRETDRLGIEILEWQESGGDRDIVVIDNIWLQVAREASYLARAKPLLNIGGLMRYDRGTGGILLNQLRIQGQEANPINAQKKASIVKTILGNLGAGFSQAVISGADNVAYQPLRIPDARYNVFPDSWKAGGGLDLSRLPGGEQRIADVDWSIADFRTSPIPGMVVLEQGEASRSVLELEGLQADALLFLHSFQPDRATQRWQRDWERTWERRHDRKGEAPPSQGPVVFRYRIHFNDGSHLEVPMRWQNDVLAYDQAPDARFGAHRVWSAADGDKHVAVYMSGWSNPDPSRGIVGIELLPAADGKDWGQPAVFALTAAHLSGE